MAGANEAIGATAPTVSLEEDAALPPGMDVAALKLLEAAPELAAVANLRSIFMDNHCWH